MEIDQYLGVFIEESKEHLQALNQNLLVLEKQPEDIGVVNEIFRSAHTLKGMSATMGYQDLANLTHQMENVLDAIRNHQIKINPEILDIVFDAVDSLEEMVLDIESGGAGTKEVSELVSQLAAIESGEAPLQSAAAVAEEPISDTSGLILDEFELAVLRESEEKGFQNFYTKVTLREDCMLKAARVYMVFEVLESLGEVVKSNPDVSQLEDEAFDLTFEVLLVTQEPKELIEEKVLKVSEIDAVSIQNFFIDTYKHVQDEGQEEVTASVDKEKVEETTIEKKAQQSNKTIRVNIERLDILMNLFEELVIDRGRLEQIADDVKHPELHETVERMARISGDLQSIVLTMRMVSIDQVFNRFPRMVRQLAKDLGKKIDLQIEGAETELDRTVIDEIGDPLVHLIRNSLDHGVETPEVRRELGKPETGTIKLKAYHSGNHVFIDITDDGAGINRKKVTEKAIKNGLITKEQAAIMNDNQVFSLIMQSGFSTADTISDISGRGVGLDVVRNTIESLGGTITINSEEGKGSIFSIELPLTLSIISVLLVEIQNEKYAVPLSSIIETAIIPKADIMHVHNQAVIDFRGRVVPLVSLKEVFQVPEVKEETDYYSVVIIKKGDKSAGLIVDGFIGQQEIVLKSLGNYLTEIFAISGATILGDGQVALIIDSNALIK
ncbi:chemotaxis protein CheA [Terribacillus saccharophilus]|uniref:Chemotaxis protein CheA n=1 Tax=Terribacillus saccharophilus TaxID=361277 RepID=A0ABX4H371_9BACI|nr:chemotaxis protein CheA [Terribacillus saccharophilus]PAD37025.1 chemotaxis protein CheA [Terribacillus saccharophilus]PAD97501.1 chemotaxis protein CheA [Terribacillus saccharophilus]PAE01550.1 chemotaxis protein CheA [Terribacillus saccharophilus]